MQHPCQSVPRLPPSPATLAKYLLGSFLPIPTEWEGAALLVDMVRGHLID